MKILPSLAISFLSLGIWTATAVAQNPAPSSAWFKSNPAWTQDGETLTATGPVKPLLTSRLYTGDAVIHFEFQLGADTVAAVYLEGRYAIELSNERMGALLPVLEPKSGDASDGSVPSLVNAASKPGSWQTFDAKFRVPRFDEAHNKLQPALIMEAKINGLVVQSNTISIRPSRGAEMSWEDSGGPLALGVEKGTFAVRKLSFLRADFDAVKVPAVSGQPTNLTALVDLVQQGEATFRSFGCVECHAVQLGDTSAKAGPNLFGLFTLEPRDRTIVSGGEGHRFTIKADRSYLQRSVRTPQEELAIGENGPKKGEVYPPVMPTFAPAVLSDHQIDAIYAYFGTLNKITQQGPVTQLVQEAALKNYDPMADRLQELVAGTVRIRRGPMEHVSARSIHVGQPNGINYTFDPRILGVAKVWQGGFLDLTGEFTARGGNGYKTGFDSREIDLGSSGSLLAPLNAKGQPIDFSFKDAIFHDGDTIRESLNSTRDHLDRLAEIDAQFLGYARDSRNPLAVPVFKYRIARNFVDVQTEIAVTGDVRIIVKGKFASAQTFAINDKALSKLTVTAGELKDGLWIVPAGLRGEAIAQGHLPVAAQTWRPKSTQFVYNRQPLVVEPSHPHLPPGYSAETYLGPKDNYGRDMLFEALGLAVAPDGTLVVATRTAGIWRLVHGEWLLFAEGLLDSLGVQVEDKHGFKVVAGQKPELTRISDTNGDGIADSYETMTDAFSYHGNYHSYMHGPVRAPDGSYFITLNLDDGSNTDYEYRANGKYMGTSGGFRGWAIHVPAKGGFEPWANGLRSPAGIGFGPDGRLFYLENQGEYVGTSKLFELKRNAFYGHPAGLVDLPGMTPSSPEIAWDKVSARREKPIVLFPEDRLANSPGHPVWQLPANKFGPFEGQMFVGDQTQSNLMRVVTEKVDGIEQGVVITFATDLESGVMRPVFLPDGSLILGETGRGWSAKGGHVASLQRIVWDGKTTPPLIHHVSAVPGGFDLVFTVPIPAASNDAVLAGDLKIQSWVYRDAPDYGSPEMDDHAEAVSSVKISDDRKVLHVTLTKTEQPVLHPQQTPRVYHIIVNAKPIWGDNIGPGFDAFYTLYRFPTAK